MDNPLISVIVPVYNTALWLRRCLDSICAQSYRNMEILCVNDGSTDESGSILEEYAVKDARIKVIHQKNAGLSAARNTALAQATGEWITGVDSDDYIASDLYERAILCADDEVDVVFFGVQEVDENGRLLPKRDYFDLPESGGDTMSYDLAEKLNACFWNKLWRRRIIQENEIVFPIGLVHEDEAFYYTILPHVDKVAMCHCAGYMYVHRSGSIMHSEKSVLECLRRYLPVLQHVYNRLGELADERQFSWYLLMLRRAYADYYHQCPEALREQLAEQFYEVVCEQPSFQNKLKDYRFLCMVPVRGWKRMFLTRYLNAEVYRFLGVPVWLVEYEHGVAVRRSCMLVSAILRKLGFRKSAL